MHQLLITVAGFIGMGALWLWHSFRTRKLTQEKSALEALVKSQKGTVDGLKNANKYAADELHKRTEALAKENPAAALDDFFSVIDELRKD